MGLFDFFRKKRKAKARRKRRSRSSSSRSKRSFAKLRAEIENLQTHIGTMNIALNKHDNELAEHTKLIGNHSKVLENLEKLVETIKIEAPTKEIMAPVRPVGVTTPQFQAEATPENPPEKLDINRFSEQEKRIMAVFFQNKDMALSYVDIARALNKSPHTVKNQMNRMRLKADLFNRTVDNDSRNRFRLKDNLRIEKYLNVG